VRVRCINNDKSVLPSAIYKKYSDNLDDKALISRKEYIVYALAHFEESLWYCIFAEDFNFFPIYKHFCFFEISDPKISRFWIFDLYLEKSTNFEIYVSFPEWIKEEYFYANLVDGKKREQRIFDRYKELMDLEFPDPNISISAEVGDKSWLICPNCIDAWECHNNIDALVKCPKCGNKWNNPRYIDRLDRVNWSNT